MAQPSQSSGSVPWFKAAKSCAFAFSVLETDEDMYGHVKSPSSIHHASPRLFALQVHMEKHEDTHRPADHQGTAPWKERAAASDKADTWTALVMRSRSDKVDTQKGIGCQRWMVMKLLGQGQAWRTLVECVSSMGCQKK